MDIVDTAINDIALGGLEGLTLPGLWTWLSQSERPLSVEGDGGLKAFLWRGILQCKELDFWLKDPDWKEPKQPKKGKQKDEEMVLSGWVADVKNGIAGYCPDYNARRCISDEIRNEQLGHEDVYEKWRENLFIVASQAFRRRVLLGDENPCDLSITDARHTVLELIGKTRHNGFLQKDFKNFAMDSRSGFHHVKILQKSGLITKQLCTFKTDGNRPNIRTNIIYLKRFHKVAVNIYLLEYARVTKLIGEQPGGLIEFQQLKQETKYGRKKLKQTRDYLYSKGYIQYLQDGQVFNFSQGCETLHHKFNFASPLYIQLLKPFNPNELNEDEDELDEEVAYIAKCKHTYPQMVKEIHPLQQMHWLIDSKEGQGMTMEEFGTLACVPYHTARTFTRQLQRRNTTKTVITDNFKQKLFNIVSARHFHKSEVVKNLAQESGRTEDLKNSTAENGSASIPQMIRDKSAEHEAGSDLQEDSSFQMAEEDQKQSKKQSEKKSETGKMNKKKQETVRGLRRQNMILEKIQDLQVIEGYNQIYKAVTLQEQKMGMKGQACRRSVHTLLKKMVSEGLIKSFEIVMPSGNSTTSFIYYCDANITMENEIFQKAVSETKFRLKSLVERRLVKRGEKKSHYVANRGTEDITPPNNTNLADFVNTSQSAENSIDTDTDNEEYEPVTGAGYQRPQYGYLPRFPRIKMLQFFLWWLVYGKRGDAVVSKAETDERVEVEEIENDLNVNRFEWLSELQDLPQSRLGKGYFQTGDALAVMPLVIFTKCVGLAVKSNTIERMLKHPKKRFTPLRDLPPRLKKKMFEGRVAGAHIGHFIESIVLLTHMGLLYIPPEKLPANRTQIVLFVSKEAMLLDTTISEKAYSKILLEPRHPKVHARQASSAEHNGELFALGAFLSYVYDQNGFYLIIRLPASAKSFPKLFYKFDDLPSIAKYWKDVQYICLNTRLGLVRASRAKAQGEQVKAQRTYRTVMTLREFQEHFPNKDPEKAPPKLFGDGLGAAGMDSTFFGHLPKNWSYPGTRMDKASKMGKATIAADAEKRVAVPVQGFSTRIAKSIVAKANLGGKGKKRKRTFDNKIVSDASPSKKSKSDGKALEISNAKADDAKLKKIMAARYRQKLAKIVKPNARRSDGHIKKDDIDLAAEKRKKSVRVTFSQREDAAILMARIASQLLEFDVNKHNYWKVARNLIHKELPEANDKTTEALGRRGRYILKNPRTLENLKSCVLECRADKRFIIKPPSLKDDDAWKESFKDMYAKVRERFRNKLAPEDFKYEIPDTLEELKAMFIVGKAIEGTKTKDLQNPEEISSNDIELHVLEQLIHNSLASQSSKDYDPSLVFPIFDSYSPESLRQALYSLKAKNLIARLRMRAPRRRALPISTITYSLSVAYEKIFELPLPANVFVTGKNFMKMMKSGKMHVEDVIAAENSKVKSKNKQDDVTGSINRLVGDKVATDNAISKQSDSACKDREKEESCMTQPFIEDECKIDDESQSHLKNTWEHTLTPGSMLYSQDKVLGGHISSMFSLLLTNRAFLHIEIPDDIMEDEQRSSAPSVGFLRKEVHSAHVQEAREKECLKQTMNATNEDSEDALEEPKEDHIENEPTEQGPRQRNNALAFAENGTGFDNNKAFSTKTFSFGVRLSDNSQDLHSRRKINEKEFQRARQDHSSDTDIESSFEILSRHEQVDENVSKEAKGSDVKYPSTDHSIIDGDESAIPKKKRKVTFFDADMAACTSSKRKVHIVNNMSQGSLRKKPILESKDQPETYDMYSGIIEFKVKASGSTIAFLSDQQLINRFRDNSCADKALCVLQPEMKFIRSRYHSAQKRSFGQAVQSEVKKIHVSRTALMFHRSEIAEKDPLDGRLFLSPESVALKPMKIYCHLNSLQDPYQLPTNEKPYTMDENVSVGDSPIDRFLRKDLQSVSARELDRGLHLLSFEDFQCIMRDNFTWSNEELEFARAVYTTAHERREHGVTQSDISAIYIHHNGVKDMEEMVNMLLNFKLLLKVGISATRYVTPFFGSLWSMKSPHIDQESEADQVLPDKKSGKKGETLNKDGGNILDGERIIENPATREENFMISDEKRGSACSSAFEQPREVKLDFDFGNQESCSSTHSKSIMKGCVSSETAFEPRPSLKQVEVVSKKKTSYVEEIFAESHEAIAPAESTQKEGRESSNNARVPGDQEETNKKHRTFKYCVPRGVKGKEFDIPRDKITVSHMSSESKEAKHGETKTEKCLVYHSTKTETYYRQAVCRPWLKLNCDLCPRMLRKFQRAILSLIMMCPGIKESALQGHFRTLLSPVALKEILYSLELNECISKHVHVRIKKPSLFDSVGSFLISDGECDDGESADPYYLPKSECTIKITED